MIALTMLCKTGELSRVGWEDGWGMAGLTWRGGAGRGHLTGRHETTRTKGHLPRQGASVRSVGVCGCRGGWRAEEGEGEGEEEEE